MLLYISAVHLNLERQQEVMQLCDAACCRNPEADNCERGSGGRQRRGDRKVPGYEQKRMPLWISECLDFFFFLSNVWCFS